MKEHISGEMTMSPENVGKWVEEAATTYNVCHVDVGIMDGRIIQLRSQDCVHVKELDGEDVN